MMKIEKRNLVLQISLIFFILFVIYLLLPSYDEKNGFYNEIFTQNYTILYKDGKTPLHFSVIKKILNGEVVEFQPNETIGSIESSEYKDLVEKNGIYYPDFPLIPDYIISASILPFKFILTSEIITYKALILINIILSIIPAIIFYFFARELKLNAKISMVASIILSLGSSLIVLSRYLFLNTTFFLLFYCLFIYLAIKFYPKFNPRRGIIIFLVLSIGILSGITDLKIVALFLAFHWLLLNLIGIRLWNKYEFLIPVIIILLSVFVDFKYNFHSIKFPHYSYAIETKLYKRLYILDTYYFSQKPGNAIFYHGSSSMFLTLFGERGVIFNSPYLIFSILGIFWYKYKKRKMLVFLLLGYILSLVAYTSWYGGSSPRYIRFSFPIAFILNFFVFYFLGKGLNKKNLLNMFLIFMLNVFVAASILNVSSLFMRRDWSYEHPVDLFSYDLVLWPWVEPTINESIINLYSKDEQQKWELNWGEGCNPPITEPRFSDSGIETGPCVCSFENNASRVIEIPSHFDILKIFACCRYAGGDGAIGYVMIDGDEIGKFHINSLSCNEFLFNVSKFSDNKRYVLTLSSSRTFKCDEEVILWKKIEFFKYNETVPSYPFDLIQEQRKWLLSEEPCEAEFVRDYIITDYCYCKNPSFAKIDFILSKNKANIKIDACTVYSGGDGVKGKVYLDDSLFLEVFISSNECITINKTVISSPGKHKLTLIPEIYGECDAEIVKWKSIVIEGG